MREEPQTKEAFVTEEIPEADAEPEGLPTEENTANGDTANGDTADEDTPSGFCLEDFLKEAVSLLLMAWLFVLFAMFPFYMQDGYVSIGNSKYFFYRDVTVGAFALIIPMALVYRLVCAVNRRKSKDRFQIKENRRGKEVLKGKEALKGKEVLTGKEVLKGLRMSVTDWAVLGYGFFVLVSFLCSDFKKEGLWGESGWYMGLITQLLFVASYFLVSRFWEFDRRILYVALAASTGVFFLGLLNRYSIFPIKVEGANNGFLSTLGNINWYCGYLAVFLPLGVLLYWASERMALRLMGFLAAAVGMATGVSQGSNSAFLVFAGLFIFVFCLSFQSGEKMKRFLELSMLLCLVCQGQRLYRSLVPGSFDYYEGSLSDRLTLSPLTLYALIPLFLLYLFILFGIKKKGRNMARYKMLRQILLLLLAVTLGVYLFLLVLNSGAKEGIRFMGELSFLRFNKLWGSSRGGTWTAGYDLFRNMTWGERFTGVGPDCFAMYLYTIPDIRERVMDQFGTSRLTNAHNEWLSVLVNNGIPGLVCYAGIFLSAVIRFVYRAKKPFSKEETKDGRQWLLYLFAGAALSYTVHNMVSFQQILSTPFIFCLLAMGERLLREGRSRQAADS